MSSRPSAALSEAAAAIDEVLVAETAAREAMEACRREAEAILEAAREEARHINRRATARITRLHARCDELLVARIAAIRAAAREDALRSDLNAADRELLVRAVDRLAARLTQPADG
jgi:vacuolar-type H+-ATPase subunit H